MTNSKSRSEDGGKKIRMVPGGVLSVQISQNSVGLIGCAQVKNMSINSAGISWLCEISWWQISKMSLLKLVLN